MVSLDDCIVVGAGLAGAVSARLLAESGKKVLVIEKRKHVGGNCYDYQNEYGIRIHKYGPHIFHTNSEECWDYVQRFTPFSTYQHRVLSYTQGKYFSFPLNRQTINEFFGKNLANSEVLDFLKLQADNSEFNPEIPSFRDAVISQIGNDLYSAFYENYTRKQWECDPSELSADLAKRIPVRTNSDDRYFSDKYQGLPLHGYTRFVENILDHPSIHILLGVDYLTYRENFPSKLTVYTGGLDGFFDFKMGKLLYRSLRLEFQSFPEKHRLPAPVVNYPNDYKYTRATEFKRLTGSKSDCTTICYEYPQLSGEPFYIVPDIGNRGRRESYITETEELEKTGRFLFIGRLAEYKYYNMDEVILSALKKIHAWLK